MWTWINCYLSRRHDYGMWCEPGIIFLRCLHCGRRTTGWRLDEADEPANPTEKRPVKIEIQPVRHHAHI